MVTACSAMLNAESQRNSFKRKIKLGYSPRLRKGRSVRVCVFTFQERYSDNKMRADL